jgi:hypothetical protein
LHEVVGRVDEDAGVAHAEGDLLFLARLVGGGLEGDVGVCVARGRGFCWGRFGVTYAG